MMLAEAIDKIADAIAFAEGYYVPGSRAQRNHNPGNLTLDLTGKAVARDGQFVVYSTPADGWEALKKQVNLILTNASRIYNSGMSVLEIARLYTTTEQMAWASNVASRLGISLNVPIASLVDGVAVGAGVLLIFALLWLIAAGQKEKS